jgi:membrane protease YdiL (CAAX protease family)
VLVPELAKFLTFGKLALITGVIWALFHYPWMLSPIYTRTPPTFASITTFTVGIMAASVALAWITLVSRSLWPAVLFHACHNAFVAGVLERALQPTEPAYRTFIGVSGYSMAFGYCILAIICWRMRHLIPAPIQTGSGLEVKGSPAAARQFE